MVAAYKELAIGADVSKLKPDEITAYITTYLEKEDVDTSKLTPGGITAFVLAYEEVTGGALTTSLTPTNIAAIVTAYLEAENVDLSKLTGPQIDALVNSYAEAVGCDKSALKAEVVAMITAYEEAEGIQKPSFISTQISITGYDLTAYRQFVTDNPVEVTGIVRLSSVYENPEDALLDKNATFWKDGVEIPSTMVPTELLTADKVAVMDEDGTMHILLTPEVTGSAEAIAALRKEVQEVNQLGATALGRASGIMPATLMDFVDAAINRIETFNNQKGSIWQLWGLLEGGAKNTLDTSMKLDFSPDNLASLSTYISEVVTAIQNGSKVSEEDLGNLKSIVDFLNGLELTGVGENVTAGIGDAMTAAGWETDAESVAQNLVNALNAALEIHSPSERVKPIGTNAAAGVGFGMAGYDMSTDADILAGNITAALQASINLWTVGLNAMAGLKAGIYAGRAGVIDAMRSAARAAVTAAKAELKINSPSGVFRDEVGRMTMKGLGQGVLLESKAQAKVIHNAARYLTGAAKDGAISTTSNDNRRTYNQTSSVNLSGNNFYIRDEQDIRSLAVEIATLTRRQQRGKGLRMA